MNASQFYWSPTIWLAFVAIILVGITLIVPLARKQSCIPQTLVALTIQVFLGVALFMNFGLVSDDIAYHASTVSQADSWALGTESANAFLNSGKESITIVVALFYYLIGANPLLGITLFAVLMSAIPVMMAFSSSNFGFNSSASIAAWLGALSPPFLLWAPWLRREALAYFLLAGVVVGLSLVYRGKAKAGIPLLVVLTAALAVTRAQLVLVAISGFFAAWLLSRPAKRSDNKPQTSRRVVSLMGAVLVLGVIAYWLIPVSYWTTYLNGGIGGGIASNSAVDQNLRVAGVSWEFNSSPIGFLINLFRELWGPPIWEWENLTWMVVGLDGLFYFLMTVLVIQAWRTCRQHRRAISVLLISIMPLVVGTALSMANYGIVMRVRSHFLPFLIPIMSIYINVLVAKYITRLPPQRFLTFTNNRAEALDPVSHQSVPNER